MQASSNIVYTQWCANQPVQRHGKVLHAAFLLRHYLHAFRYRSVEQSATTTSATYLHSDTGNSSSWLRSKRTKLRLVARPKRTSWRHCRRFTELGEIQLKVKYSRPSFTGTRRWTSRWPEVCILSPKSKGGIYSISMQVCIVKTHQVMNRMDLNEGKPISQMQEHATSCTIKHEGAHNDSALSMTTHKSINNLLQSLGKDLI